METANDERLIRGFRVDLVQPGCHPGSGAFGARVQVKVDLRPVFPYLHALWENANHDPRSEVVLGANAHQRYALRPTEIRIGRVEDSADAHAQAARVVEQINTVWRDRASITPRTTVKRVPAALEIFRLLPQTNCRECGRPTCLAFANGLRQGDVSVEDCPPLRTPEGVAAREQLLGLFEKERP